MEKKYDIVEEFIAKESRTEYDAVHPRFRIPKKEKEIQTYQDLHDYYCDECKLYFAPDFEGLSTHFKEDIVQHKPAGECVYCDGPVYQYKFKKEPKLYHNCKDVEKK